MSAIESNTTPHRENTDSEAGFGIYPEKSEISNFSENVNWSGPSNTTIFAAKSRHQQQNNDILMDTK